MLFGYSLTIERGLPHSSKRHTETNSYPRQASNYFLVRGRCTRHYAASPALFISSRSRPSSLYTSLVILSLSSLLFFFLSLSTSQSVFPSLISLGHYASLTSEQVRRSTRRTHRETRKEKEEDTQPPSGARGIRIPGYCLASRINRNEKNGSLPTTSRGDG